MKPDDFYTCVLLTSKFYVLGLIPIICSLRTRGNVYLGREIIDEAIEDFKKALKLMPSTHHLASITFNELKRAKATKANLYVYTFLGLT